MRKSPNRAEVNPTSQGISAPPRPPSTKTNPVSCDACLPKCRVKIAKVVGKTAASPNPARPAPAWPQGGEVRKFSKAGVSQVAPLFRRAGPNRLPCGARISARHDRWHCQSVCIVGRTMSSLTSTSAGCSMANATARAMASASIAVSVRGLSASAVPASVM